MEKNQKLKENKWGKEFDKEFCVEETENRKFILNYTEVEAEPIKSFIRQLLIREKTKSYSEGLEEGIKDGYKNFQEWKKKWVGEILKELEKLMLKDKAYCHLPECQKRDTNDLPCDCGIEQRNNLYDIFREEINQKIEALKRKLKS